MANEAGDARTAWNEPRTQEEPSFSMARRCRPRKLTELELRGWTALSCRLLVQARGCLPSQRLAAGEVAQLGGALLKPHLSGGGGWSTVWEHPQTG